MRSPASDFHGHDGMLDLAAKVGELRIELNNQLTLVRSELNDIHTRLPTREKRNINEEAVGHAGAHSSQQGSWRPETRAALAEHGNQRQEPEIEMGLEHDNVWKNTQVQGNTNTETLVAPQTVSGGSNDWLGDLDAAMMAMPSYENNSVPRGFGQHQVIATLEDLAKLREHVKNGLVHVVATAKKVAIQSVEAHVHKLLTGMDHISAQRENIVIDNSQRESTTMLHAALDRLAISHGQLLEAVAPSTTMLQAAVDRLATSHGQLLEAVAEQAERVKFIELQIFPSHADSSVCNTPRDSAKVRFKLNI
mmetsp:Transcript_94501/g.182282  ORF Transcript_94501/g.182282 Transcript_94501/m.182282 type:complete len:307 (+) Transcript_94501:93-1013(+)